MWRERQGRGRMQPASQSTSLFRSCGRDRAEDSAAPSVLQRHFKPELQICSFISVQRQRQEGRGLKWRRRFTLGCLSRVGLCYLLFSKTLRPALPVIFLPGRQSCAERRRHRRVSALSSSARAFCVRHICWLLRAPELFPALSCARVACLSLQPLPGRSLLSAFSARREQI